MKPQLCTAALCLTCKAGETLGVDSQGPGAHRLNALQERSTNWVLYPRTSSNKPRRWPNWTLNWSYPCTDPTWALLSSSALQEAPWWMEGASTTLQCLQGWESHSKWKKNNSYLRGTEVDIKAPTQRSLCFFLWFMYCKILKRSPLLHSWRVQITPHIFLGGKQWSQSPTEAHGDGGSYIRTPGWALATFKSVKLKSSCSNPSSLPVHNEIAVVGPHRRPHVPVLCLWGLCVWPKDSSKPEKMQNKPRFKPWSIETIIQIQEQTSAGTSPGIYLFAIYPICKSLHSSFSTSPTHEWVEPSITVPNSPSGEEEEVHQPRDDGGQQAPILENLRQKEKVGGTTL